MTTVRIALPAHLRTLAAVGSEVRVEVPDAPTVADALGALEAAHPALAGTLRDRATGRRRPFIRYLACGRDLSHEPDDAPLPGPVAAGDEPLHVIAAIAGGEAAPAGLPASPTRSGEGVSGAPTRGRRAARDGRACPG